MDSSACPLIERYCGCPQTREAILLEPQSDLGHQPDKLEESYEFQKLEHLRGLLWPELSENVFHTKQTQNPFRACEGSITEIQEPENHCFSKYFSYFKDWNFRTELFPTSLSPFVLTFRSDVFYPFILKEWDLTTKLSDIWKIDKCGYSGKLVWLSFLCVLNLGLRSACIPSMFQVLNWVVYICCLL